jgi:uncharacterized membrane protein
MASERTVVLKHVRHWQQRGLVADVQAAELLAASEELLRGGTSLLVKGTLAGLGAGLVLAGAGLVAAEHWFTIDRFAKLGGWALLQVAFLALAHDLGRRFPDRPALAEASSLVAGGLVLAGIVLVAEIYHLDGRNANAVWLWLALVLPMPFALPRRTPAAVVGAALLLALTFEVFEPGSPVRVREADGPWLWLGLPLLAAAAASRLPRAPESIRGFAGAWAFAILQLALLVLGASQDLDSSALGRAWAVVLPGLAWALWRPHDALPAGLAASEWRLLLCGSLLPFALLGGGYDPASTLDFAGVVLAWIVQLAAAVFVVRAGARSQAAGWINAGYAAIALGILVRYFDFFGDALEGGLALLVTGLVILGVSFAVERSRRRALRRAAEVAR